MAKQRIVNTRFWDDSYVIRLEPNEKLLFLYLLTNPLTNIAGVYELPQRRIVYDTGLDTSTVERALMKLERDGKAIVSGDWIAIVNFIRHQSLNPKVLQGIRLELQKAPKELVDRLPIDFRRLGIASHRLSHPNPNSNTNPNARTVADAPPLEEGRTARPSLLEMYKARNPG
jgi:hypothetical protein